MPEYSAKKRIHFFSPIYFDAESFLILRERVNAVLPEDYEGRFHVVDDSGGLDPLAVSLEKIPDVDVISVPYQLGHQRALVYGLREFLSKNEEAALVVTMDGDGEDRPEDLPHLLEAYQKEESLRPIVLAKRTKRRERFSFKLFYFFYKLVFRALTGTLIQTGNFAVYHSTVARQILCHPYFDLSYASTLFALGRTLRFVPCPRGVRYCGQSRMNFLRLANHGVRMMMPFMDKIAVRGVIAFSLSSVCGFALCVSLTFIHLTGIYLVPSWALLASALAFVLSFLLICNFAILLTIFANVQALAFSRIDRTPEQAP